MLFTNWCIMSSCFGCELISDTDKLSCVECKKNFHYSCVGYTQPNFSILSTRSKANWKCHACKAPSKTDDSTPVKSMLDGSPQRMSIQTDSLEEYFNKLESSLLLNLKLEIALLIDNKLESALAPLKQEIYEIPVLLKCVEFMNEKFDEMHKEVCELRTKPTAGSARSAQGAAVWRRVRLKLEGRDTERRLTPHDQVDYIITEATSAENLCLMYEGWMAWV
ncbi:hypothetical protein ACJJTC_001050 [Scirpophaga incertulas]